MTEPTKQVPLWRHPAYGAVTPALLSLLLAIDRSDRS